MANRNDYNRIMHKAWSTMPDGANFNVWPNRAATAVKAIWKANMGRPLRKPIRFSSGNRISWERGGELVINPDEGWIELNHSISHLIARRKGLGAHSDQHLEIERSGAELILRRGFPTVDPQPVKETPVRDVVAERAARVDARIEKWEAKLRRAENALKKLRKKQRYYRKKLSEPRPEPKERKPRKRRGTIQELADLHGIELEKKEYGGYEVWPPDGLYDDDELDPYSEEGHSCHDAKEARERIMCYAEKIGLRELPA